MKKHRLPLEGGAWRRTADGELERDTAPDPVSADPTHDTADRIADAKPDSKPAPVATRGRGKHRED